MQFNIKLFAISLYALIFEHSGFTVLLFIYRHISMVDTYNISEQLVTYMTLHIFILLIHDFMSHFEIFRCQLNFCPFLS